MNKFNDFIGKYFNIIALSLLVILFLRTCNSDTKNVKMRNFNPQSLLEHGGDLVYEGSGLLGDG
jgi:hypothetical protein